jgi:tRNA U54 and U55 pseudouridine synthase Pus10
VTNKRVSIKIFGKSSVFTSKIFTDEEPEIIVTCCIDQAEVNDVHIDIKEIKYQVKYLKKKRQLSRSMRKNFFKCG